MIVVGTNVLAYLYLPMDCTSKAESLLKHYPQILKDFSTIAKPL